MKGSKKNKSEIYDRNYFWSYYRSNDNILKIRQSPSPSRADDWDGP